MFKEGDYIVCLHNIEDERDFPANFIFRQRRDWSSLSVELSARGQSNGWGYIKWNPKDAKLLWRYATSLEIETYEVLGKPYNTKDIIYTETCDLSYKYLNPWIKKINKIWLEKKEELQVE